MRRIGIILALFFATISYAEVYTPEEVPNPKSQGQEYYVSNPDGILSDSTVNWVNGCAARLEQETEVELCVVVLESIGEEDAFDFAYELFQRWGIGQKGKNTGVLILFAGESHDLRIMTGTGIEGVLTDGICSKIMYEEMFPSFREGDYDMGICLGVLAIYDVCTDGETPEELQAVRSVTNRGRYGEEEDEEWFGWSVTERVMIGGAILFVLGLFVLGWIESIKRCPKCHKRKGHEIHRETLEYATYDYDGKALVTYKCKNCGHEFTLEERIPKLVHESRSSGSSRGGGWSSGGSRGGSWGGGSTSGGGAGGKW